MAKQDIKTLAKFTLGKEETDEVSHLVQLS